MPDYLSGIADRNEVLDTEEVWSRRAIAMLYGVLGMASTGEITFPDAETEATFVEAMQTGLAKAPVHLVASLVEQLMGFDAEDLA